MHVLSQKTGLFLLRSLRLLYRRGCLRNLRFRLSLVNRIPANLISHFEHGFAQLSNLSKKKERKSQKKANIGPIYSSLLQPTRSQKEKLIKKTQKNLQESETAYSVQRKAESESSGMPRTTVKVLFREPGREKCTLFGASGIHLYFRVHFMMELWSLIPPPNAA